MRTTLEKLKMEIAIYNAFRGADTVDFTLSVWEEDYKNSEIEIQFGTFKKLEDSDGLEITEEYEAYDYLKRINNSINFRKGTYWRAELPKEMFAHI